MACSIVLAIVLPACNRSGAGQRSSPGTVTLVNRVRVVVQGVSCADCGAKLQAVLGQRLDPATITISRDVDRVDVEFQRSASPFSSASLRSAVAEVGGEVVSVQIDACGTIDTTPHGSWLNSGSTRLLLEGPGPWLSGMELCISGELHDDATPVRLVAGKFRS